MLVRLCSAGLLSSLAHRRAGIPDAMLAVGALSVLTDRLMTDASETVRHSCAVTLGYLTYNKTAARLLFAACRNTPGLYDQIITQIGPAARVNPDFITDYKCARKVGLPCMRYYYYLLFIIKSYTKYKYDINHKKHQYALASCCSEAREQATIAFYQ